MELFKREGAISQRWYPVCPTVACNVRVNEVLVRVDKLCYAGYPFALFGVVNYVLALLTKAGDAEFDNVPSTQILLRVLAHTNAGRRAR